MEEQREQIREQQKASWNKFSWLGYNKVEFKGSFSLNRLGFGHGEKSIILSNMVEVNIWIGASMEMN